MLNISRTGNLEQEVKVICYTEDWTATKGVNFEERPNALSSAIVFPPNVTHGSCKVTLTGGKQVDLKVAFRVRLFAPPGNANVGQESVVVVFITQDIKHSEPLLKLLFYNL